MKKFIVITSIFPPTEAVISFAKMNDYKLVVVGDKKTPADWSCKNVEYLSMQRQSETGTYLHKVLPYNHYGRKMMGYLFSINKQADLIVDTDDDNIPKQDWSFPSFKGDFPSITEKGFVNIYQLYTDKKIWPRGLPLRHISTKYALEQQLKNKKCKVGIWQGLADEDPDVDAIYRLTSDELCYFKERSEPVVLSAGTVSPFNSQNTMFAKDLFPLMYLPCLVTFRFTDILRGLIAQPIMWLDHYNLGFTNATVIQKRNPHNYFDDFISEIPMYEHSESIIDIVSGAISSANSITDNLFNAYEHLGKKDIVQTREIDILTAWLKDIENK